jgi:hypothetical protein
VCHNTPDTLPLSSNRAPPPASIMHPFHSTPQTPTLLGTSSSSSAPTLWNIHHSSISWSDTKTRCKVLGVAITIFAVLAILVIFLTMYFLKYGLWAPSSSNSGPGGLAGTANYQLAMQAAIEGNAVNVNLTGVWIPQGWGTVWYPAVLTSAAQLDSAVIGVYGTYIEAGWFVSDLVKDSWPGQLNTMMRNQFGDGGMGWIGVGNTYIGNNFGLAASHAAVDSQSHWPDNSGSIITGYGPGGITMGANESLTVAVTMTFVGDGRYVQIWFASDCYTPNAFFVGLASTSLGANQQYQIDGENPICVSNSQNAQYGIFSTSVVDAGMYVAGQVVTITAQPTPGLNVKISGVRFLTSWNFNATSPQPNTGIVIDNWSSGAYTQWAGSSSDIGWWLNDPAGQYWGGDPSDPISAVTYSTYGNHLNIIALGWYDCYDGATMSNVRTNYRQLLRTFHNITGDRHPHDTILLFAMIVSEPSNQASSVVADGGFQVDSTYASNWNSLVAYAKSDALSNGYAWVDLGQVYDYDWTSFQSAGGFGSNLDFSGSGSGSPYVSSTGAGVIATQLMQILDGTMSGWTVLAEVLNA